jgi:uncharacterized protein (TIGR02246 family)
MDDETAIRDLVQNWMEASRRGDVDAVLTMMTDDVVFIVPNSEPFGKRRFAEAAATMRDVKLDGSAELIELQILGDWAFGRARIAISLTAPDGNTANRSGYALTVYRKEDGAWKVARDANLVS